MYQINFKIGGNVEKTRIKSMIQINTDAAEIVQDNQDIEDLRKRYESLDIPEHSRNIIDDYIACILSREKRMEVLIYYAGMLDSDAYKG